MERGVIRAERLEVAVIGAEHEVFSDSALVQIAGKGRERALLILPRTITFFHYGKSKAMVEAVHHIQMMNKDAMNKGLLYE